MHTFLVFISFAPVRDFGQCRPKQAMAAISTSRPVSVRQSESAVLVDGKTLDSTDQRFLPISTVND
jgi:hypothetical protein